MVSTSGIENMLDRLERTFEARFDKIDANITDVHEKHAKLDKRLVKPREFKREGNKDQHNFNSGIFDFYEDAKAAMLQNNPTKAIDIMDKGMEALKFRQKLIVIADTYGWDVVKEYVGTEMASDSDDDSKIRRCFAAAERKKKVTATKDSKKKGRNYGSNDRSYSRNNDRNYHRRSPFRESRGNRQQNGTCHTCGGYGHWSTECASKKRPAFDKKT